MARFAIDPARSTIRYAVKTGLLFKTRGVFRGLSGTLDEAGSGEVTCELAQLDAHIPPLTEKLRGADYFDVERFPQARFVAKEIARKGARVLARGTLALHGVSAELSWEGTAEARGNELHVKATAELLRSAFGLTQKGDGVKDRVELKAELVLTKA
jgi:polyisoprenoid-binding protein YceI